MTKGKNEPLGIVIVESGWGSMLPTVVVANMMPGGPAARFVLQPDMELITMTFVSAFDQRWTAEYWRSDYFREWNQSRWFTTLIMPDSNKSRSIASRRSMAMGDGHISECETFNYRPSSRRSMSACRRSTHSTARHEISGRDRGASEEQLLLIFFVFVSLLLQLGFSVQNGIVSLVASTARSRVTPAPIDLQPSPWWDR